MVACCDHPQALDRVATSGRFGDLPPASEADVAAMTARWCAAAVEQLAADVIGRRSDAADRLTWRAEDPSRSVQGGDVSAPPWRGEFLGQVLVIFDTLGLAEVLARW